MSQQHKIIGTLLLEAQSKLNELGINYVFVLEGNDTIFSNVSQNYAVKILNDSVMYQNTLQEKVIEAKVEKLVDEMFWGKDKE